MARSGRERGTLTREAILAEALRLVDEEGLDACSFRALGARLGVSQTAFYRHVPDKAALLDGIVELIWREVLDGLGDYLAASGAPGASAVTAVFDAFDETAVSRGAYICPTEVDAGSVVAPSVPAATAAAHSAPTFSVEGDAESLATSHGASASAAASVTDAAVLMTPATAAGTELSAACASDGDAVAPSVDEALAPTAFGASVALPALDGWRGLFERYAHRLRAVLLAHPNAVLLMLTHPITTLQQLAATASALVALEGAGYPVGGDTLDLITAVTVYTTGFTAAEAVAPVGGAGGEPSGHALDEACAQLSDPERAVMGRLLAPMAAAGEQWALGGQFAPGLHALLRGWTSR